MKKAIKVWNKIEEWFLIILMGLMASVVFIQVISRTLAGSLPWSEELSRYLTAWIAFVGGSYGFREGAHIGVDVIKNILPGKARNFVEILGYIICFALSVIVVALGITVIKSQMSFNQLSPAMRIPMWTAYLSIPVGFTFCALRNLELILTHFSTRTEETDNNVKSEVI